MSTIGTRKTGIIQKLSATESQIMITAKQIRAARAYLGWSQQALADHAEISVPTVKRLEGNDLDTTTYSIVKKVIAALENAGIEFLESGIRERLSSGGSK